jgi:hypothetical protein
MLTLPTLVKLEDYNGDWEKYEEALYSIFKADFIKNITLFQEQRVSVVKDPLFKKKESTFWHITSEGKTEAERTPDLRKCERIKWIKYILENANSAEIKTWEEEGKGKIRVCICYGSWEYIVVLMKRNGYFLLLTAYPLEREHTRIKMEKAYKRAKSAQKDGFHTPSTHGR